MSYDTVYVPSSWSTMGCAMPGPTIVSSKLSPPMPRSSSNWSRATTVIVLVAAEVAVVVPLPLMRQCEATVGAGATTGWKGEP